jgi:arylsulfatase A-like enzyme
MKQSLLFTLVLLLAVFPSGCSRESETSESQTPGENVQPESNSETINILALQKYARSVYDTTEITPDIESQDYHLLSGWKFLSAKKSDERRQKDVFVANSRIAELRFSAFDMYERVFSFRAKSEGPFGGGKYNEVEISLNDRSLGRYEISNSFNSVSIRLPAAEIRRGNNIIKFNFSLLHQNPYWLGKREDHSPYPYPYTCAYFEQFSIKGLDDTSSTVKHAFNYFTDTGFLQQRANSSFSVVLPGKVNAEISFSGQIQRESTLNENITLSLLAKYEGEASSKILWQETHQISDSTLVASFDHRLNYIAPESLVQFELVVDSDKDNSDSFVVWKNVDYKIPDPRKQQIAQSPDLSKLKSVKHVLFLVLDAARSNVFAAYGGRDGATPHLDTFSQEALVFENAVAPAPYTITAVASLFSGLLPEAHGVRRVTQSFPLERDNLPRAFARSGWYCLSLSGSQFLKPKFKLIEDFTLNINLEPDTDSVQHRSTMSRSAINKGMFEFVSQAKAGRNVFVYVHLLPPHWPYKPPKEYANIFSLGMPQPVLRRSWQIRDAVNAEVLNEKSQDVLTYRRMYLDNVRYADHLANSIISALKEADLYDKTMIVVTSDHGESLGEKNHFGHSHSLFREMINVPLMIRIPGVQHRQVSNTVGWIDLFPTFSKLFELETEDVSFQGRDISALFAGTSDDTEVYYYSRAMGRNLKFSIQNQHYKYIMHAAEEYLYDLKEDKFETKNLVDTLPILASKLRQNGLALLYYNLSIADAESEVELETREIENLRNLGYLQ